MKNNLILGITTAIAMSMTLFFTAFDAKASAPISQASCSHIPCNGSVVTQYQHHYVGASSCVISQRSVTKCNCCGAVVAIHGNWYYLYEHYHTGPFPDYIVYQ